MENGITGDGATVLRFGHPRTLGRLSTAISLQGSALVDKVRAGAAPSMLSLPVATEALLHGVGLDARGRDDGGMPSPLAAAAAFLRSALRRL